MDVLAYSAFNQQIVLNQQIAAKTSCLNTKCSETAAQQAVAAGLSAEAVCWVRCIEPCLLRTPALACSLWNCIPDITATSGIKVCRCSGNSFFNYGACCLWTVPAGATRIRFQLWGAGGSSGHGCCCGGSPFGASGAYASVIIPATPGCQYTVCSGCAQLSFGCGGSPYCRMPGCPSWVTGFGLCNFCANGGPGRLGNWMAAYGATMNCRIRVFGINYCGPYICNSGGDYCYTSSCGCTFGIIPYVAAAPYFGTTTFASGGSVVYGIRGSWPQFAMNNYSVCNWHPPVYCMMGACQINLSSSCAGCFRRACCGIMAFPGVGGAPTTVYGGCTTAISDFGRGGMVCVSWC